MSEIFLNGTVCEMTGWIFRCIKKITTKKTAMSIGVIRFDLTINRNANLTYLLIKKNTFYFHTITDNILFLLVCF